LDHKSFGRLHDVSCICLGISQEYQSVLFNRRVHLDICVANGSDCFTEIRTLNLSLPHAKSFSILSSSPKLDSNPFRLHQSHFTPENLQFSWVILSLSTIYIAFIAWRYGSSYAFTIHASCCNPWIALPLGAACMSLGSVIVPYDAYSLYSNKIGELLYTSSIVYITPKVIKELEVNTETVESLESMRISEPSRISSMEVGLTAMKSNSLFIK
jgi:hypothetical protein